MVGAVTARKGRQLSVLVSTRDSQVALTVSLENSMVYSALAEKMAGYVAMGPYRGGMQSNDFLI